MTVDRMMDGAIRKGIEEAIRFLQPGQSYAAEVDSHEVAVVRLAGGIVFLAVCRTCSRLVVESADLRRVYPAIYRHTEEPIDG